MNALDNTNPGRRDSGKNTSPNKSKVKQKIHPFYAKTWWVSWADKRSGVRVADRINSRTRTAAKRQAERLHPKGVSFRVGPYLGGVEIPQNHKEPLC